MEDVYIETTQNFDLPNVWIFQEIKVQDKLVFSKKALSCVPWRQAAVGRRRRARCDVWCVRSVSDSGRAKHVIVFVMYGIL